MTTDQLNLLLAMTATVIAIGRALAAGESAALPEGMLDDLDALRAKVSERPLSPV